MMKGIETSCMILLYQRKKQVGYNYFDVVKMSISVYDKVNLTNWFTLRSTAKLISLYNESHYGGELELGLNMC